MEYLIVFIVCILGGVIQGSTGFGLAILAMSILPFFIPFKIASAVVLLMCITNNIQVAYHLRKHINYRSIIPVILSSLAGRSLGVYGLMNINVEILKIVLGVALVLLSIYFYRYNNKVRMKSSTKNGIVMGAISGILGGLFNIGGPPVVIYLFSALEDKTEYNASIQATFVLSNGYSILLHFLYGNMNLTVMKYASVGFIAIVAGCYIGLRIFERINKETLSKAIYSFMAIMGIMMIIKG